MNKAITILFVLLLAQQTIALRINNHFDDAPAANATASASGDEIPKVLGEIEADVEKTLNDSRKPGEENATLEKVAKHRIEEALEDARKEISNELNETDENGTRLVDALETAANEDLNKTLENAENELPEIRQKFIEALNQAFENGFLESQAGEDGKTKFVATEKLNEASKGGFEAGAGELEKQLNEAFEALNKLFDL